MALSSLRPLSATAALLATVALGGPTALAAEPPTITENDVVAGTMSIEFGTRTRQDTTGKLAAGSPAEGSRDVYTVDLNVVTTTHFSGKIERQPRLASAVLGREIQPAALQYNLTLAVRNPSNLQEKRSVGKWVGTVPIDAQGVYLLEGGSAAGSPLRIAVDTVGSAQGFTESFAGRLVGKPVEKKGLVEEVRTFSRTIAGRQVNIQVKGSDPMRFDNVVLAAGPAKIYPRTVVNGRMDFDYETGNWYTDGLRFRYTLDGVDREDVVSGSIKWTEDANRKQNGKGRYEFNLRFNEDRNRPATGESAAFAAGASEEDAFFAVDTSVPTLTGNVDFVDTMVAGRDAPTASKIAYHLNANRLTKQQVMNFFKLWMLAVGPTNDE
jgi:hypothetical protein